MQSRLKDYYMKILCQCYSEDGRILVSGNNYGELLVFEVEKFLKDEEIHEDALKSAYRKQVSSGAIYCLTTAGDYLLAGGIGEVLALSWSALLEGRLEMEWALRLPIHSGLNKPEVNAIVLSESNHKVYLAGGDNKIYKFDVETRQHLGTLEEHRDYVHDLAVNKHDNDLYSAGEDATVKLWDLRTKKSVCTVDIKKHPTLSLRSAGGSSISGRSVWVGAVTLDKSEEWLVVAGGHKPAMLHTKSMTPTVIFEEVDTECYVATLCNDLITVAGEGGKVYHYTLAGELKAAVPSSSAAVYAVAMHPTGRCCTTSGASNKIDLSRNLMYNDLVLTV